MLEPLQTGAAILDEFEQTGEVVLVHRAGDALDQVHPMAVPDFDERQAARRDKLGMWLRLLALIDSKTDPDFDPQDAPASAVEPPEHSGPFTCPGMSPDQIPDLETRRQYTEAIAANEAKSEAYGKQMRLRKMNKWATLRTEAYVHRCYLKSPRSREELGSMVEKHISDPSRAELLNALLVRQPETEE